MRRAIGIALVVAIALVFLNDVGRWVNAQSQLNENTAQLAEWAATSLAGRNRDAAAQLVTAEGTKRGLTVYQYDQDQNTVRIWGSVDVSGTWVIGPYVAITRGTPLDQALGVPFVVRSYQQAQFQ
jgi:hypothetical protein